MHVRWLRKAVANLDAEADYIAKDNTMAASRMIDRVTEAVSELGSFPSLGRPGRVPGTRELVICGTPYIIPYRVRRESVEIIRVFHGARRWPRKL